MTFETWFAKEPHGDKHLVKKAWDATFAPGVTAFDILYRWLDGEMVILEWKTYVFPHGKALVKKRLQSINGDAPVL